MPAFTARATNSPERGLFNQNYDCKINNNKKKPRDWLSPATPTISRFEGKKRSWERVTCTRAVLSCHAIRSTSRTCWISLPYVNWHPSTRMSKFRQPVELNQSSTNGDNCSENGGKQWLWCGEWERSGWNSRQDNLVMRHNWYNIAQSCVVQVPMRLYPSPDFSHFGHSYSTTYMEPWHKQGEPGFTS